MQHRTGMCRQAFNALAPSWSFKYNHLDFAKFSAGSVSRLAVWRQTQWLGLSGSKGPSLQSLSTQEVDSAQFLPLPPSQQKGVENSLFL